MVDVNKKRVGELYSNLESYLDRIKDLDLEGDNSIDVIRELIKLYKNDAYELADIIIKEGKDSGQISETEEVELRSRQKRIEKTFEYVLKSGRVDKEGE